MSRTRLLVVVAMTAAALCAQGRQQTLGVKTVVAGYTTVTATVTAPATVAIADPSRAVASTHLAGWIERVFVATPYAHVSAGEPLCTIYSPDLLAAEQDYLAARAYRDTLASSPVAGVAPGAARVLAAAADRLQQAQVPSEERQRLEQTGVARAQWTLRAPAGGTILEFTAVAQQRVSAGEALYTIAGLDPIWVYADVPENELASAAPDARVQLSFDAYPGREFSGHVQAIEPRVVVASRTVPVRIEVANPQQLLRPGMSGTAVLSHAAGRHLVLPADAVFQTGTSAIAFVADGAGHFTPRTLRLGQRFGDDDVVLGGVRAGERVASSAQFLLDADAQLSAALGQYAPPAAGVGGNAQPTAAWQLALTTAPAPPHAGSNQVRVQLTGPPGAGFAGIEVSVTFFMPAMPAMGMAAERVTAALNGQGGGRYAGTVQLSSAGDWQVSVTATRAGQTLATLHTSIRATSTKNQAQPRLGAPGPQAEASISGTRGAFAALGPAPII